MKIYVATHNAHKVREISEILGGIEVLPDDPEGVEENAPDFAGNALIKVRAIAARHRGDWCMADDSGLEVRALGGAPGVRSARYAGEPSDTPRNNALLLKNLAGVADRTANFTCAVALVAPDGTERVAVGKCFGRIAEQPAGTDGFGYDPLFIPHEQVTTAPSPSLLSHPRSFAELSASEKNAISHRGRALAAAKRILFDAPPSPAHRQLRDLLARYIDGYRTADGALPEMMQLKHDHIARVAHNAELIADGEGFDDATREAALAAALLHDTGRFEQLKRYNTFRDSDSVDHAVFSHDIVRDLGWLDGRPDRDAVLAAVLVHNRRDIPDGFDPLALAAAKTVRDADKLDIFRVLESLVSTTDWRHDRTAFWNLDITGAPNPEVIRCIEARQPVDYQEIKTLSDFVLIQIGWMISGLEYATTRRLCRERGHLAFRRRFLHELSDDPAIDRLCDLAINHL